MNLKKSVNYFRKKNKVTATMSYRKNVRYFPYVTIPFYICENILHSINRGSLEPLSGFRPIF